MTPLTEAFVELRATGELCLDAINMDDGTVVSLQLNEDYTLASASVRHPNPTNGKNQTFTIQLPDGQGILSDLILPQKLALFYDDHPAYEVALISASSNEPLDDAFFRLEHD